MQSGNSTATGTSGVSGEGKAARVLGFASQSSLVAGRKADRVLGMGGVRNASSGSLRSAKESLRSFDERTYDSCSFLPIQSKRRLTLGPDAAVDHRLARQIFPRASTRCPSLRLLFHYPPLLRLPARSHRLPTTRAVRPPPGGPRPRSPSPTDCRGRPKSTSAKLRSRSSSRRSSEGRGSRTRSRGTRRALSRTTARPRRGIRTIPPRDLRRTERASWRRTKCRTRSPRRRRTPRTPRSQCRRSSRTTPSWRPHQSLAPTRSSVPHLLRSLTGLLPQPLRAPSAVPPYQRRPLVPTPRSPQLARRLSPHSPTHPYRPSPPVNEPTRSSRPPRPAHADTSAQTRSTRSKVVPPSRARRAVRSSRLARASRSSTGATTTTTSTNGPTRTRTSDPAACRAPSR